MGDIDIRRTKAVLFDRGNVTHDCRGGPPQQSRQQESAGALARYLSRFTERPVDAAVIIDRVIAPWTATFEFRDARGHEAPLEPVIHALLESLSVSASDQAVSTMVLDSHKFSTR